MVNAQAAGMACALGVIAFHFLQSGPLVTSLLCIAAYLAMQAVLATRTKPYPPGPRGWPVIRNLLQIPQNKPWLVYAAWADTYGDVIHLEAFNYHLVILNSAQAAKELLDGRSAIYSDRPASTMAELCGYDVGLGMLSYNDEWRKQRKFVAQAFASGMLSRYYSIQEDEARRLVQGLLRDPGTVVSQTKRRIAAIIMRVTYGYTVKVEDDRMITMQFEAMDNFTYASEPGVWIVDFIPQLQYLPRWMPGASFLRTAQAFKELEHDATRMPYLWCKEQIQAGKAEPCLVASALEQCDGKMSDEDEVALILGTNSALGGGLDTNMSSIFSFLLLMTRHPDIQAKAQAEIDEVVGTERLPSIKDRPSLPYLRSVITEVYRCYPAGPQGLPHSLRQDDVYKDYLLPKASIIIPNIWRMLHDPDVFPQPDEFKPERFANSDTEMRKVTDLLFGFGRRACPGSQFAEGSVFAIAATILATCNVVPKIDERGNPIIPDMEYTSSFITFPKHIVCDFKPRSEKAQELLEEYVSRGD
ncbi:cytochrome P450 [Fomitopsis serialis]|uniref:cytochrome P450 n=1 Tax=Fomitopsis serialis TaxID=139415 RepID=UPI0020079338|nr:cytochrome P450 [Neoantrodia serialis]KAH9934272.1 cytochrome P450 [Neoantrodia serialis]